MANNVQISIYHLFCTSPLLRAEAVDLNHSLYDKIVLIFYLRVICCFCQLFVSFLHGDIWDETIGVAHLSSYR